MSETRAKRCETCAYFQPIEWEKATGHCHEGTPVAAHHSLSSAWPPVPAHEWCGKWAAKDGDALDLAEAALTKSEHEAPNEGEPNAALAARHEERERWMRACSVASYMHPRGKAQQAIKAVRDEALTQASRDNVAMYTQLSQEQAKESDKPEHRST